MSFFDPLVDKIINKVKELLEETKKKQDITQNLYFSLEDLENLLI